MLEHRGSFGKATRFSFNVRFNLMTSDVVLFSGKAGAGGKGAMAVNAKPGMYAVGPPVESLPVPGPPVETKAGPSPQQDHVVDLHAGEVEEQPGKALMSAWQMSCWRARLTEQLPHCRTAAAAPVCIRLPRPTNGLHVLSLLTRVLRPAAACNRAAGPCHGCWAWS
jgi:hypothetical protein